MSDDSLAHGTQDLESAYLFLPGAAAKTPKRTSFPIESSFENSTSIGRVYDDIGPKIEPAEKPCCDINRKKKEMKFGKKRYKLKGQ